MKTLVVECGDWRSEPIECEWVEKSWPEGRGSSVIEWIIYPLETTVVTVRDEGVPMLFVYQDGMKMAWQQVHGSILMAGETITLEGRDAL